MEPTRYVTTDAAKAADALRDALGRRHDPSQEEVQVPPPEPKGRARTPDAQQVYLDKAHADLKQQHAELMRLHRNLKDEIEQRQRAEESLFASLKAWQDTFDATQDAICVLNLDHKVLALQPGDGEARGSIGRVVGRPALLRSLPLHTGPGRSLSSPRGCGRANAGRPWSSATATDGLVPLPIRSWMRRAR